MKRISMVFMGAYLLSSCQKEIVDSPVFQNDGRMVYDPTCGQSNGVIYVIPIYGTPPFEYSIDGGKTYFKGPNEGYSFENIAPGTYFLKMKDARNLQSQTVKKEVNCQVR